jgi:hypothetical protein
MDEILIEGEVVLVQKHNSMGFVQIEIEDRTISGQFTASGLNPVSLRLTAEQARRVPSESHVQVIVRVVRSGPV